MDQYLNDRKAATPALIHSYSYLSLGISNIITKFVECPVVESVPLLETTLYTGQLYIPVSGVCLSGCGSNWIIGRPKISNNIT